MAAGNVLSGVGGSVKSGATVLDHIGKWSLSRKSNNSAYASSSTAGFKKRVAGTKDYDGSFEGLVHDGGAIPVSEGGSVTLELHVDATGLNYYSCPVLVENVDVDVDINDGKETGYTASFAGNGAYTKNGSVV